MTMNPDIISSDFPFESRYVEIHGSKMHYADEGTGSPLLFLHGNLTSSYLWRNVIPHVIPFGRVIALDLIGMGKSDKPDIDYRFFDHVRYVEGFIEQLALKNVTLVLHDWGSALGFHYAMRHEENVKGLAFMEAILMPESWSAFPGSMRMGFRLMRTPVTGWLAIVGMNLFINQLMPRAVVRKLTNVEMEHYREPFKSRKSRKPILQWPKEIPIDGKPADVHEAVAVYSEKLQQSAIPKLLFYAEPGGIITASKLAWAKQNLKNLKTVDVGPGIHYIQEDNPHLIGYEIGMWFREL